MSKVLLINPSYQGSYGGAKASIVNPIQPTLGLATIAAMALHRGHQVEILDMSWRRYNYQEIQSRISNFKPDIVGVTATTPLMNQLRDISVLAKDISKSIKVVGGGSHPSALPEETLKESLLDVVFVGEADYAFSEFCDGWELRDIKGIYYRADDKIVSTGWRTPINNLDDLPMPAWELYDPEVYKRSASRLLIRRPPATMAEFSRGCVFKCDFCASKITMALGYRKKSPERCAEEVRRMYQLGFREFMLADDIFTSDQKWAIQVCEAIIKTGIDIAWSCTNGIRVESADNTLFTTLRKAGCYRVSFGFESGNDAVLKKFGKGGRASVEQGRQAVQMARAAGIDANGFFLLGLSPDTEETMKETISYARKLPLDMLKFGITVAFPGTPMFKVYADKGLIKSFEWDDYHIYTERPLFSHPELSYDKILNYVDLAYRHTILFNPAYILRRARRGIRTGEFFWDLYYFLKFILMPSTNKSAAVMYYGKSKWPVWDFRIAKLNLSQYQIVSRETDMQPSDKHQVSPPPALESA
ncbi:MAG: cobalamin B12-binding domain-containing protein [Nitrospirae bacterium]|nr:cobalamin B12-binding domain-containing protein [Nitrospirota bacterium]